MDHRDRARRRLFDALNGGQDEIPPATRRGLIALADDIDFTFEEIRDLRRELVASVEQLRRALFGAAGGVIVAIVGSAIGVFFTR